VFTGGAILLRYAPATLLAQAITADARRAQLGAAPIETTKLAERLVMLSGPGGNVVVSHGDFKVVVDGFVLPAWPRLKAALDGLDGSPIKSLIDTHWHFDHADNNANFRKAGAGVIAHENTTTRLLQSHDLLGMHFDPAPTAALPTQTFAAGLTLNANGEQIDIRHVAPAHTDTDVLVFFPKANVLHMGDVFFNGRYPFIDASTGGHINGMIAGVEAGLRIANAQTKIVPGHGTLAQRPSLEAFGRMLTGVRDAVLKLKAGGKTLAEVQAAKPSAPFDADWGKGGMGPDDFVALVYNTLP
jgi:glyoxylase-like metal-dependent hydrolase (beta-lactamase superfamily II)